MRRRLSCSAVIDHGSPCPGPSTWPLYLAACWALAWALIAVAGVQVDNQFTVFGAIGAVSVTAATLVLPFALARPAVRSAS